MCVYICLPVCPHNTAFPIRNVCPAVHREAGAISAVVNQIHADVKQGQRGISLSTRAENPAQECRTTEQVSMNILGIMPHRAQIAHTLSIQKRML